MNYDESVSYMQGLLRFGEKYGNERFEELLRRLDKPQYQFTAIHIAGTKGKGSTTSFAASILRAAGHRTGSYFSPYVYDLRERIQIDGEMISKDDFARWVTLIRPHIESISSATDLGQITEFELKTAVALCFFAEQKVDYAVLEVGLGGRLDATNVIPPPLACVITNIGYDHMDLLGNTLELIAAEKAGIVKAGSICMTGIDGGPALATVRTICAERDVPLRQVVQGRDWVSDEDHSLTIRTSRRTVSGLKLRMRGTFQHANAALALHAIDASTIPTIDDRAVIDGLESATAPGRMEVVRENGLTIILDAAHNELAALRLTESLIGDFHAKDRPLYLVIGMSYRHDPKDLLSVLLTQLDPVLLIATEPSFRPRPASDVAEAAKWLLMDRIESVPKVPDAAKRAVELAAGVDDALILVTGSFFTIGDIPPKFWRKLGL